MSRIAMIVCLVAMIGSAASAAVVGIDSATFSTAADPIRTETEITSITLGSDTYSVLTGGTTDGLDGGDRFWGADTTDPGDDDAVASGLRADTGLLNATTGRLWMFGHSLADVEGIFVIDLAAGSNDSIENVVAVDVNGDQITGSEIGGGIGANKWGPTLSGLTADRQNGSTENQWAIIGVAFTAADFGDGSLDPSTIYGVVLGDDQKNFDPVVVGTYAVPEPASMALLGLGGLVMLRRKR